MRNYLKNLDLKTLIDEIKKSASHVIVLAHPNYKGSERLTKELQMVGIKFEEASNLKDAVDHAALMTKEGSMLFSPAFASFGMFKNEYERNDQFLLLVKNL